MESLKNGVNDTFDGAKLYARSDRSRRNFPIIGTHFTRSPIEVRLYAGLNCGLAENGQIQKKSLKRLDVRMIATMENPKMEFPEIVGKSIAELNIYDDPDYGREFLIRFTDGTELSVSIGIRQTIEARYYREGKPDTPIFVREE